MSKDTNNISEKLLISNLSMVDADIISSILESYNIPHMKKSKGSGGLMEIYTGFNNYGIDIYVPSNAFQEAKELIDSQNIIENE
ncbi:MAG: DUF2007 domain-containing protein [Tissierellia bacterium]|nr:DUF2007 domain-containing protein [Tissierellia bacterium]MDD4781124.1 DUF2007 domain-containing protein [Tissierellia bacterium]